MRNGPGGGQGWLVQGPAHGGRRQAGVGAGSKAAVDDELGDDLLVPVTRTGIKALGREETVVYGVVVVRARG